MKAQVPGRRQRPGGLDSIRGYAPRTSTLVAGMRGKFTADTRSFVPHREQMCVFTRGDLSFMLAPESGGVRVLVSASGGVEVERSGAVRSRVVAPEARALGNAVSELSADTPEMVRRALIEAGSKLSEAFLRNDALLLEINPLFVLADGSWLAGDAKMVVDDNAHFPPA